MRSRVCLLILILSFAFNVQAARVIEHLDLDSLVQLSQAIVRAQVGAFQHFDTRDGKCDVHEVTILDVFKGPVKAGDSFRVAGIDEYRRSPDMIDSNQTYAPIHQGDIVYLFLLPNDGKRGYAMYKLTNATWTVIESGLRLQAGPRVYDFAQYVPRSNGPFPGPFAGPVPGLVAMTEKTSPGTPALMRLSFENSLRRSLKSVEDLSGFLKQPASADKLDQYIQLLRNRLDKSDQAPVGRDLIAENLAGKIGELADPKAVDELRQKATWHTRTTFDYALQGDRGRDYLLARVADVNVPADRRVEYADLLSHCGWTYFRECRDYKREQLKDFHADFATHLAQIAIDNFGTKISDELLRAVADCVFRDLRFPEALRTDLQSAARVLGTAYEKAPPRDRFRIIEFFMALGLDPSRPQLPPPGLFASILSPARDFSDSLKRRQLHLDLEYRSYVPKQAPAPQLTLILQSLNTDAETVFPLNKKTPNFGNSGGDFGSDDVNFQLPPTFPAGRYHLFLRAFSGEKPLGDSLGFDSYIN